MLVCNHKRRIRFYVTGIPGAIHDNSVYQNSELAEFSDNYFSPGEYILADSAYRVSSIVIPCYKTGSTQATQEEIEKFNLEVAHTRVAIEHCNGILKGKFQSLQDLRITINTDESLIEAGNWIRACCVLHNFLLYDPIDFEEYQESHQQRSPRNTENQSMENDDINSKRNQLKNDI